MERRPPYRPLPPREWNAEVRSLAVPRTAYLAWVAVLVALTAFLVVSLNLVASTVAG